MSDEQPDERASTHGHGDEDNFGDKWTKGAKLDDGKYGNIFKCWETGDEKAQRYASNAEQPPYVVKEMPKEHRRSQRNEIWALNQLSDVAGFAKMVDAYDEGDGDDAKLRIVLRFIKGQSLKAVRAKGQNEDSGAWDQWGDKNMGVRYLQWMLDLVLKMHLAGVGHNDLHHKNLMYTADAKTGGTTLVIIDFGLATPVTPSCVLYDLASIHDLVSLMTKKRQHQLTNQKLKDLHTKMDDEWEAVLERLNEPVAAWHKQTFKRIIDKGVADGLFPNAAPQALVSYGDSGGFQAGYDGDDYGCMGEWSDGDEEVSDRLREVRRENRALLKERRRLRAQFAEVKRLLGQAKAVVG